MKNTGKVIIVLFLFLCCFSLLTAGKNKTYGNVAISEIVSVYDGDTFTVNIKQYPPIVGEKISVRIYGVDTPEIKGKTVREKEMAIQAKEFVEERFKTARVIELRNLQRDKYFRLLAEVYVDGENLSETLIKQGLGRPYFGNTKQSW